MRSHLFLVNSAEANNCEGGGALKSVALCQIVLMDKFNEELSSEEKA